MSIAAIIVAVVLAFLALRFIGGVIKFAVLAVIVIAVAWYLTQGGAA